MIAFISDIHGNYPALQAVLKKIDEIGCSQIICLGDVVGYYSEVNECIETIRLRRIPCLLGNHDYYLVSNTCCSSKTVKLCLDYQRTVILSEHLTWLQENVPAVDLPNVSLRHAGWHDALEERFSAFDFSWVQDMPQKVYLSGHTHRQTVSINETTDRVYCNPGSVGQPRDNDPRAAFAVLNDSGSIVLYRVKYDIEATVRAMKKCKLGDWIYKGLYTGKQIGIE